jgi:hypothetical protein
MKRCPKCQQIFPGDDSVFCIDDGATLVPHTATPDSGYISGDAPTQVLQRPSSPPAGGENSTKWLYLVIGVLATALVAGGVIIYLTRGKEDKPGNTPAAANTNYKTVTPDNSAPAKNTAAVNTPAAPGNTAPSMRLSPGGNWAGDWTSPSGAYLTIKVNLDDDGAGNVQGQIEWTLRRTTRPEKMNKIGMTAIEYVRGKYDPSTRNLTMSGYRKDDPNNVLVMVDDYRLGLTADNRGLNGAARNGGKWDGKIKLQRE